MTGSSRDRQGAVVQAWGLLPWGLVSVRKAT